MLVKVAGGTTLPPAANEGKDGDYYDVCPTHGGEEVEAKFKAGGRDGKGEEYRDWSIFSSDIRDGGCGDSWSRTTASGAERLRTHGKEPAQLTRGAQRTIMPSPTSEAYRENYERIFGHP